MNPDQRPVEPYFEREDFDFAIEFNALLRNTYAQWQVGPGQWSFRGQADAEWRLKPSAFRPEYQENFRRPFSWRRSIHASYTTLKKSHGDWEFLTEDNVGYIVSQAEWEAWMAKEFFNTGDDIGVSMPEAEEPDSSGTKNLELERPDGTFVPTGDTILLAQHHGVLTRALDFTSRPGIAAFFAAHGSATEEQPAERFGIFAWNRERCPAVQARRCDVLKSKNPFLRAQEGHFLIFGNPEKYFLRYGEWPSLEGLLNEVAAFEGKSSKPARPPLKLMTLPSHEARPLLTLLQKDGITLPRLMPSLDNVGKNAREQFLVRTNGY